MRINVIAGYAKSTTYNPNCKTNIDKGEKSLKTP